MNRGLLAFAIFLIVVGGLFGLIAVAFFGVILLIPALVTTPRRYPRTPAPTTTAPPTRITPPPRAAQAVSTKPSTPSSTPSAPVVTSQPTATVSFSAPLFPHAIFPTLGLPVAGASPSEAQPPPSQRDELLEIGAIYLALRILQGYGT